MLCQKSLGFSIMVSNFIVESHRYLHDDKGEARLYLETNATDILTTKCSLNRLKMPCKYSNINFQK